MKFKVGDRVKAVSESHAWGEVKKGDIGIITKIYDKYEIGDYGVDFPSQKDWKANEKDLELVKTVRSCDDGWHVGARVMAIKDTFDGKITKGLTGTIKVYEEGDPTVGVEWDTLTDGHSLSGRCLEGHGWHVNKDTIELIDKPFSLIMDEMLKYYDHFTQPSDWYTQVTGTFDLGESTKKVSLKERIHMLSKIAKRLLDADTKALVKAGWLDSELDVTGEGEQAIFSFLMGQYKKELAAEARKEIKENKDHEDEE